jgi:GNAT superfamily N-acetyltransferase
MALQVRRLGRDDDRSGFQSGTIELDRFFTCYAGQNQFRHHLGTTYIAVESSGFIAGFVTVTASELAPEAFPISKSKRPRYPMPVLRVARLAVDERAQGKGIGSVLLRSAFALARQMAEHLGCVGVVVDAKPLAVAFYEKLGFVRLQAASGKLGDRPEPLPMFLELSQLPEGAA